MAIRKNNDFNKVTGQPKTMGMSLPSFRRKMDELLAPPKKKKKSPSIPREKAGRVG